MYNENADPLVKETVQVIINVDEEGIDVTMLMCPFCNGFYGVDTSYLDQCSYTIHCPMCCTETHISSFMEKKDGRADIR